jgi:hypothetical protein
MKRWKHRPEGSTWGDWGDDDQLGRLNLITPKKVLEGIAEVKEGLSFCLSLPLDLPGGNVLNPRRLPPVLSPTGDENGWRFNFHTNTINPLFMDVASDDRVILTLQYSTQWDTLAHVGGMFDADGDGVPEPLYYNGFKAGSDVVGPAARRRARRLRPYELRPQARRREHGGQGDPGPRRDGRSRETLRPRPQVRELRRFRRVLEATRWWSSRATCCCSIPASPTRSPR